MLTTTAPGSSGGINLAAVSRGLGAGGGAERGVIHGGGLTHATSGIDSGTAASRPVSGGPGPGRTDEEIQIVFDRHKAQLYRLYNLELRRDPTLQGKDHPAADHRARRHRIDVPAAGDQHECAAAVGAGGGTVKTFNFGAKSVPPVTIVYPIDFLPAM